MARKGTLKLIFIVGVGRSGTSLLQSMFAAHPTISCLPETSFLRRYATRNILQSIFRSSGQQSVIDHLKADEYFARTGLDARQLTQQASAGAGSFDVMVYRSMLDATMRKPSAYVVDKDPRMIEFLPMLHVAVPDAHVVNVIRDPRDVLASKKKAAWARSGHVWKHIFANRVQLRLGRKEGKRLFGDKYHEVVYEELISNPERSLFLLCEKLGLTYSASMLNFGAAAQRLVSPGEMSWKKETLGPLLNGNKGKWTQGLSCREVRLTETCCGEAMRVGDYVVEPSCTKLGFIDRLWVLAGRLMITTWTKPYQLYRTQSLKIRCRRAN